MSIQKTFLFFLFLGKAFAATSNWIVVTTIQYPTEQLQNLAKIPNWHLLVIGDKKTPLDWELENCTYIGPEKQLSLGYEITELLPWNHYSRKNIGYLYAIEHGATLIYDTDDDNEPIGALETLISKSSVCLPILESFDDCINPYPYFGCPNIWARGFPPEKFLQNSYTVSPQAHECFIGVEQGLVNHDPDLDAICRLSHSEPIFFTNTPPCQIKKGNFAPFNSQNTFFHRDSFFALYLPSTCTMRVSDIWRGYICQRLLQNTALSIVFSKPSAIQKRNEHNWLNDFILENDLYTKGSVFVQFLKNWENSNPDFFCSMYNLYESIAEGAFLKNTELPIVSAWLHDLQKIKYTNNSL